MLIMRSILYAIVVWSPATPGFRVLCLAINEFYFGRMKKLNPKKDARLDLRIEGELLQRLEAAARRMDRSIGWLVRHYIMRGLGQDDKGNGGQKASKDSG